MARDGSSAGDVSSDRADETAAVRWRRIEDPPSPVVMEAPYAECKLEHPGLEPTGIDESFFPDAVPYRAADGHRVWYWRPILDAVPPAIGGLCATPDSLHACRGEERLDPVDPVQDGTRIVVDGTVAGDATTATVRSYAVPDVRVLVLAPDEFRLSIDGQRHVCVPGTRTEISLPEQTVRPGPDFEDTTTLTPRVSVRFPGVRTVHHPPIDGDWRLFPSFGLSLDALSNPLSVPLGHGELDHEALATAIGVDLSTHPYPVRVLWQAFAYTVFDPHRETVPDIGRTQTGQLLVRGR